MLAIYLLWHRLMAVDLHRPAPEKVIAAALTELARPSMYAYAVGVLLGHTPPWTLDDLCELAEQRYEDLQRRRPVELPPRVDSALWVLVAQHLLSDRAALLARAAIGIPATSKIACPHFGRSARLRGAWTRHLLTQCDLASWEQPGSRWAR